jgi:NADPH-dependent 2,4-dienoyl-CoA reductase/sulfur reductase-like enzyme
MSSAEIAIVGAGPAGLAAATEAVIGGARVVVIDDNRQAGGQYFRQLPGAFHRTSMGALDTDQPRAEALLRILTHPAVDYRPETTVWSLSEERILSFAGPRGSGRLAAGCVILCTGAHDRAIPFPGWTLPGVISAGGLQNLVKEQRLLPGRRAVVAGNGPLLLVAAASLLRGGANVTQVIEAAPVTRRLLPRLPALAASPKILQLALAYRALLMRHGVRFSTGETVIEALGKDRLKELQVAPIDEEGRIRRDRARRMEADILITGFGLRTSSELYEILGCRLTRLDHRGGLLPARNDELETSCANILAAGDGAGIGGIELALLEGALAGIIALRRAGRGISAAHGRKQVALRRQLARMRRFRNGLESLYRGPVSYLQLLTPETLVCRCEEVTAGALTPASSEDLPSAMALKGATRIGMGRCQGRFCQPTLAALIAARDGCPVEAVRLPRIRPPARLVRIGDLLSEEVPEAMLPAHPHLPRGEKVE